MKARYISRALEKKGQAFILDLMIGLVVFTLAFSLIIAVYTNQGRDYDNLQADAELISEIFLTKGIPMGWNLSTVVQPGVISGERINRTRFEMMQQMDYDELRSSYRTSYDLYIHLRNKSSSISIGAREGIGKPGMNSTKLELDVENLAKVTRLAVFEGEIVQVIVYLWE